MRMVQNAAKLISVVIGEQEIDTNKQYRMLKFCIKSEYNGVTLLFNNMTKEFLVLTSQENDILKECNIKLSNEFLITLAKKWFLVPADHDDAKLSNQITSLGKQLANNNIINSFTILPTTACNARCFYCFEAGAKPVVMTEKTAIDVAEFIIKKSNGSKVAITWFGGEPLCNYKAIDTILNYLKVHNVDTYSTMVSNGYLFDDKMVSKAVEIWNLKHIQITLDGTEEVYNRVKNYVYKNVNAFERVINNIGKLLDNNVPVTVRLNMDRHNSNDLFKLVDYLAEKFAEKKGFAVYAHLLFENEGFEKLTRTDSERDAIGEVFISLCRHIEELGIWAHKQTLRSDICTNFCMADNPQSLVIIPDGKLGRCEHYVDSLFIGDIYSDFDRAIWKDYYELSGKCSECPSMPDCLMLKKCPNCHPRCYEYERVEKVLRLENLMKRHYDNFINNALCNGDRNVDVSIC